MKFFPLFLVLAICFAVSTVSVSAQYSVSNFWGDYSPLNWTVSEYGVEMTLNQMTLSATILEIQGGDGECNNPLTCPEEILAESSVVIQHTGILHLDYIWSIWAPDCLQKKFLLNGEEMSLYSTEANGLAVEQGDTITFNIIWSPWEGDCGAGTWNLLIADFGIVFESFFYSPPPPLCPETSSDLNGDGIVNASDLLLLLAEYGNFPP